MTDLHDWKHYLASQLEAIVDADTTLEKWQHAKMYCRAAYKLGMSEDETKKRLGYDAMEHYSRVVYEHVWFKE